MLRALTVGALVAVSSGAFADAPPGPYFNGFETDTAGWFNFSGATIARVPSGSSSTYANAVAAATGNYYARLGIDPNPDSCTFGGGTARIYYGPYTDWGGYSSSFPTGGYSTGVDIYLDVPYAQSHLDTRFDWSSAINDTTGNFRRDFVFNVGTDALGFVMTGRNNSTRCGANPADPGHSPVVHITQSGWYTFKHTFSGVPGGQLVVMLEVIQKSSGIVMGTWTLSDPSDIIGTTVGGNRYGWFVQNEFDGLAIDNSFRTGMASTPGKVTGGGTIEAPVFSLTGDLLSLPALVPSAASPTAQATFGFVAMCCPPSGNLDYHDHQAGVRIKAQSIDGLFISSGPCGTDSHATFIGTASVIRSSGTTTESFTVDVDDCDQTGTPDTFGIRTATYANGPSPLISGTIEIHK